MKEFDIEEVIPKAIRFMREAEAEQEPFFVWLNTSRMHLYTGSERNGFARSSSTRVNLIITVRVCSSTIAISVSS